MWSKSNCLFYIELYSSILSIFLTWLGNVFFKLFGFISAVSDFSFPSLCPCWQWQTSVRSKLKPQIWESVILTTCVYLSAQHISLQLLPQKPQFILIFFFFFFSVYASCKTRKKWITGHWKSWGMDFFLFFKKNEIWMFSLKYNHGCKNSLT